MKRHALIFGVAVVLAVLGFAKLLLADPLQLIRTLLIPVLVFGVIFLLYKYQPGRRKSRATPKVKPSARTMEKVAAAKKTHTAGKRKHYPFQVIEGSKGKNDDQPKYH
ncbi:hypothetical protein [Paenibacillus dokdonensis]|uniref:hypothetical protein n=1 Tax=Paenibacillus dokdonensis TaxID=2567944 RepID=UPI0010A92DBC|nr:hypothetical protein [Paenibacillus dokdonensis]